MESNDSPAIPDGGRHQTSPASLRGSWSRKPFYLCILILFTAVQKKKKKSNKKEQMKFYEKNHAPETANLQRFESSVFARLFGCLSPEVIHFHSGFGRRKGWSLDCTTLFSQSGIMIKICHSHLQLIQLWILTRLYQLQISFVMYYFSKKLRSNQYTFFNTGVQVFYSCFPFRTNPDFLTQT